LVRVYSGASIGMSVARFLQQAAAGNAVDTGDDDFANVVLLLDGDGTSGDANNTFTDSSTNGYTITESGSVVQGSFSPYGDNWSNYFDGTSDYLNVYLGSTLLGQNDFTIEGWVNLDDANNAHRGIFDLGSGYLNSAITGPALAWFSTKWRIYYANGSWRDSATFSLESGKWYHFAYVRDYSASSIKLYINGVSVISQADSTSYTNSYFSIGGYYNTSYLWKGNISNFRITESVVYTTSFTPPSAPLSAITGTTLLTAGANRFFDQSATNTVAVVGTPKVTPFSPFKDNDARDITTDGGSAYFDVADTAYLSFSGGEPSVADMTISGWVYPKTMAPQAGNAYPRVFAAGGFLIYVRDDDIRIYNNNEKVQAPINNNEWTYFAAQRSSNTWTLYINGVSKGTASDSANIALNSTNYIGSNGASNYFTGYIADLRITTSGSTSTAVPTSPVSAVTNTEFLLNFQDAGIYDRSGINNLDTVGDARLGFAPIYGTGSLEFDGSGDYLKTPQNDGLELGSGDYTIECWVNISAAASVGGIFSKGLPSTLNTSTWSLEFNTTNNYVSWYVQAASTSYIITGSQNIKTSKWIHIAVTRSGNDTKLFVNGVQDGSTYTGGYTIATGGDLYLGTGFYAPTTRTITGFIDDFRITKGVARYTSDFTPPDEIDLSTDTHREYVTFFLDGDGTLNGQNNTFTDSSTNSFTVTESGSVVQGVFSPYGDNWSNYFGGNTAFQKTSGVTTIGTGDFTVEFWFYPDNVSSGYRTFYDGRKTSPYSDGVGIFQNGTSIEVWGNGQKINQTGVVTAGQWTHLALVRNSGSIQLYINGSASGSSVSLTDNFTSDKRTFGENTVGSGYTVQGYVSNLRETHSAVYTSAFTPSTSPLSSIANTEILTLQSNRFIDNSSNAYEFSIIGAGTPKVTRFSPFESNKPYDITTDGGSGYFDGSSYLSVPNSTDFDFGTGDFTWEAWIRTTVNVNYQGIVGSYLSNSATWGVHTNSSGTITYFVSGTTIFSGSTTVTDGAWHHIAIARSGTSLRLFVDGVQDGSTQTDSTSIVNSTEVRIGSLSSGLPRYFTGDISNVRIIKGTAVYTSAFTPPTAPLTAVTNTELLLNFQDSAIPDLSGLNNIDTVGNAKVGASDPTKYGSNAMAFDGTGDYIQPVVAASELALGTGDFTIEFWMYPTSVDATIRAVLSNRYDGGSNNVFACAFDNGTGTYGFGIYFHTQATGVMSTGVSPTVNTWQHLAFVRSNGTLYIYKDGTSIGTPTSFTSDLSYTVPPLIGKDGVRTGGGTASNFVGYLDDLRITKGVARYTANFTAPGAALPKF